MSSESNYNNYDDESTSNKVQVLFIGGQGNGDQLTVSASSVKSVQSVKSVKEEMYESDHRLEELEEEKVGADGVVKFFKGKPAKEHHERHSRSRSHVEFLESGYQESPKQSKPSPTGLFPATNHLDAQSHSPAANANNADSSDQSEDQFVQQPFNKTSKNENNTDSDFFNLTAEEAESLMEHQYYARTMPKQSSPNTLIAYNPA